MEIVSVMECHNLSGTRRITGSHLAESPNKLRLENMNDMHMENEYHTHIKFYNLT